MNDFEKEYYESEEFWSGDVLQDEMNIKRIELTADLIPKNCKSVLDVGCGNGKLVNYISKNNPELKRIVGTDRSETALKWVNVEKRVGEISSLPFEDAEFDCVTCCEVIEHLPQKTYESALSELARVSAKYLLISVPYNENLTDNITQCPKCRTTFNADLHLRSFDESTMNSLMHSRGFECLQTKVFFPFKRNIGATYLYKRQNKKTFNSPICPICGFENENFVVWSPSYMEEYINNPSISNRIKQALKKVWIKETIKGFWIIGIYQRISHTKNDNNN